MEHSSLSPGRIATLGAIVLMHIGLVFALQSGLQMPPAPPSGVPKEVFVTFVQPEPPKPIEAPKPPPPAPKPKPVPKVKKTVKPPPPPVRKEPAEKAITTPPEPPAPPAPPEPIEEIATTAPAEAAPPAAPSAPAAPTPSVAAPPRLITSGVEYLRTERPKYPSISQRLREEGTAVIRILINEKGQPEQIEIKTSSGYPRLDEAALKAARHYLFKPHIENGRPVAVYGLIPFTFKIP